MTISNNSACNLYSVCILGMIAKKQHLWCLNVMVKINATSNLYAIAFKLLEYQEIIYMSSSNVSKRDAQRQLPSKPKLSSYKICAITTCIFIWRVNYNNELCKACSIQVSSSSSDRWSRRRIRQSMTFIWCPLGVHLRWTRNSVVCYVILLISYTILVFL